jgi:lipopolysaccharide/colanic/teichoic acid biosynthesis glycosyltransferase
MKPVTEKRTSLPRNEATAPTQVHLSRRRVPFAALDRRHAELVEELQALLWAAPSASMMPRQRLARRIVDVVLATAALVALAPVLLVIAALIRCEDRSAPVLFRQRRCGYEGREFELLKFRTMVRDADHLKEQLRWRSTVPWPDFRLPDDPRVTRVGRVLRRTSADELPQLINVLRGEMSLVGPRPTSFKANTYELWQTERLEFRPGITGPWQVSGRDTMDFDERCRLETRFFREATLWRELRVLGATGMTVLRRTGVA